MNQSPQGFPSREEGLALHFHLRDQNPAAVADLCRAYLNPLIAWLAVKFAGVDPHHRQTAVHDALMTYVQRPEAYNPVRGDLGAYLRMATRWDLVNLLKSEGKRNEDRVGWGVVEDRAEEWNLLGAEDPALELERDEETRRWRGFLESVMENFTPEERCVLDLMLDGERKTTVYAKALRMEGLSAVEQEREVKKVKDRIKKRLERGVPEHA